MPMRSDVWALSLALALVSKSNGIAASNANTLHPVKAQTPVIGVALREVQYHSKQT